MLTRTLVLITFFWASLSLPASAGESLYADNNGVKIHYVAKGDGPLLVMIHGFPDYWYSWRHLMTELGDEYRVVAVDLRGYNKSDKPTGLDAYTMPNLIGDIAAVIEAEGRESATLIAHDWGAAIAWQFALYQPDKLDALVAMSVAHPVGFTREASKPEQLERSQYVRDFQKPGAENALTAEGLARWVKDDAARTRYIEAFKRSDFTAMLNYYRANYPQPAADGTPPPPRPVPPKIDAPVLVIHGMQDPALSSASHSGTWDWVTQDTTLLMVPEAGHFVQHDAKELVSRTIEDWLAVRISEGSQ